MGPVDWWIAISGLMVLALGAANLARSRRLARAARQLGERVERRQNQIEQRDERLTRREATLEAKVRTLELRDANLLERERAVVAAQAEVEDLSLSQRKRLEEIADLTANEARQALLEQVEREARQDAMAAAREIETRAREESGRRAREIITTAIHRLAAETTVDTTSCVIELPDDQMKGRIIGRDGRNIRAFEQVTGVNLIIDDAPATVRLSCFDGVRRETARLALDALVADGRISPDRIEAAHRRASNAIGAEIDLAGRQAAEECGVDGLPAPLLRLLGQLRYRTSFGQSVLRHSVETANLAGLMAHELGIDAKLARRCGLLHDIGKTLTHTVEGSHARIGAEVAQRLGEPAAVCHAIAAHHGEVDPRTVEAVLTQAADAISASRPGARRQAHEQYVTRLRRIEELCSSFEGVDRVHAMQAGRDVRVMVCPETVDDAGARSLAQEIAARIQAELAYPGQIAVTVVRELRARSTAT